MVNKAVFLDRDGIVNRALIINKKPYPPLSVSDTFPIKEISELIKSWHDKGYLVIVITNQPDVANHLVEKSEVDKINRYLKSLVGFDDIFVCYHSEKDNCDCRKPKVGLFKQAKEKYNIAFSKSWMIGDRKKDIDAGKKIGCQTIFVDYDYDEKKPKNFDYTVESVKEIFEIKEF
jgi:D-glycero-D-manno-heptose 1,7-bisphosphate phosphatase